MLTTERITIDCNEYDLEIDGSVAILRDAPMDLTIPDRWANLFDEEEGRRFVGLYFFGEFFRVEQDGPDWHLSRKSGPISVHHVLGAIRVNFDAIIDLGWEALKP